MHGAEEVSVLFAGQPPPLRLRRLPARVEDDPGDEQRGDEERRQRRPVARIVNVKRFGPLMLVWFVTLSALGLYHLVQQPHVLAALNPWWAVKFMIANQLVGYLVLGAVFLVVTGGEALYADMGHFGAKPIRLPWFGAVFPALLLNYFGQGALLLRNPAASDPFFLMAPRWPPGRRGARAPGVEPHRGPGLRRAVPDRRPGLLRREHHQDLRRRLVPDPHRRGGLHDLFAWMSRNTTSASTFFSLPPNQTIELGAQVRL